MSETILVNLLSEQQLPNFIATMQLMPDKVYAFTTDAFRSDVKRFEEASGIPHIEIPGTAYDLETNTKALVSRLSQLGSEPRLLINYTGGTKIMALAATLAASQLRTGSNIELLYVDTPHHRLTSFKITQGGQLVPLPDQAIDINIPFHAYAALRGEPIKEGSITEVSPEMEARKPASVALMDEECDHLFYMQNRFHTADGFAPSGEFRFQDQIKKSRKTGSVKWNGSSGLLALPGGKTVSISTEDMEEPNGAARFFAGEWLEEYCFLRLKESGKFQQIMMGVRVELRAETLESNPELVKKEFTEKTELDLVVCDGIRAAIIECKAGKVTKEHLYTLDTLRRYLLGSMGISVLVSRHEVQPKELEIAETNGIWIIESSRIKELPATLDRIFRGKV